MPNQCAPLGACSRWVTSTSFAPWGAIWSSNTATTTTASSTNAANTDGGEDSSNRNPSADRRSRGRTLTATPPAAGALTR